jgi:hypothetical protein
MKNPSDSTRKDVRFTEAHSGGFNRREFLTRTALVGAALSVGSTSWAPQQRSLRNSKKERTK